MIKIILGLTIIAGLNAVACDLSAYHKADKLLTKQIIKDDMKSASIESDKVLKVLQSLSASCKGNSEFITLQKTAIANDKTIKEYATH